MEEIVDINLDFAGNVMEAKNTKIALSLYYKDKVGRSKELPALVQGIKILGFAEHRKYNLFVVAECPECKDEWTTNIQSIKSGKARRCKDCAHRGKNNPNYRHGGAIKHSTRLYAIYYGMIARCTNPNNKAYKYYKNKSVHKEWLNSFAAFKTWALDSGYKEFLTIDRIDNKGNYEPTNCQWITVEENSRKDKLKISEIDRDSILNKRAQGSFIRKIAAEYKVSRDTMSRFINKGVTA